MCFLIFLQIYCDYNGMISSLAYVFMVYLTTLLLIWPIWCRMTRLLVINELQMQKEIVAYPYFCLGDWEAMNKRHPSVSNPKPKAHLEFFLGGWRSCWPWRYIEFYFKKCFYYIFQYSIVLVISRFQWYRLKSKSRKTCDIMSTKSVVFKFHYGGGGGQAPVLPSPHWVRQCPRPSENSTGMLNTRPLHSV